MTRHLAAFLHGAGDAKPDAILFNGGFFIPEVLRQRVADVMEHWHGRRPVIFENRDLDLAVAVGAAYYSYVRSTGSGLLVRGGLPRAYFIGLGGGESGQSCGRLCLAPRGAEEGSTIELDPGNLQLVANKPVSFRLYSSLTRTEDKAATWWSSRGTADLHLHAPLTPCCASAKRASAWCRLSSGAKLTEVGTLEIWADSKISDHRWRLQFQLRKAAARKDRRGPQRSSVTKPWPQRRRCSRRCFADGDPRAGASCPRSWNKLWGSGAIRGRSTAIRKLADRMLELAEGRKRSAGA